MNVNFEVEKEEVYRFQKKSFVIMP